MKKLFYIIFLAISVGALSSCDDDVDGTSKLDFVSFESDQISLSVPIDGSATEEIKVYATKKSGSERSFGLSVNEETSTADPESYTIPSTFTIPANSNVGVIPVELTDINIGDGKSIDLSLSTDGKTLIGKSAELVITQLCDKNEVFIMITFDGYSEECSWELLDSNNDVVASVEAYEAGLSSVSEKLCVADGTYTFNIYDAYGDGLTYPNLGGVAIISNGETVLAYDGNYDAGRSDSVDF